MPATPAAKRPTIFFSVGEPSGDLHGANLIKQLRSRAPQVRCVGFGGPKMKAAGLDVHYDLTQYAVMFFLQVLLNLVQFWRLVRQAGHYFAEQRPDAVVLIDYPGFNWWIARKAKKHGIPVFYYGVPQLWAWAPWRIRKMRRLVDHVLCKLPFEADWYNQRGCRARFVGHPYFDELHSRVLDEPFARDQLSRSGTLITLLPGSRRQEVEHNLPSLLKTAARIHQELPTTRFAIASFNQQQAMLAQRMLNDYRLPVEVHVGCTQELIAASHSCIACSGSVSLELLYYAKPSVILYRVKPMIYLLARYLLLHVRYVTLVNLLACEDRFRPDLGPYNPNQAGSERVPFPEYPTCADVSREMADHIIVWLHDEASYRQRVRQLQHLRQRLDQHRASETTAAYILESLQLTTPSVQAA